MDLNHFFTTTQASQVMGGPLRQQQTWAEPSDQCSKSTVCLVRSEASYCFVFNSYCGFTLPTVPIASVSFFGDSYVEVSELGVFASFSLSIKFLTSRRNGFLFLAEGQSDYLLTELHSGVLQVKLKLGSEEAVIHSLSGLKLNNLVWHDVLLMHDNGILTLTVDELFTTSVKVPGELNVDNGLYVGGPGELRSPYLTSASPPFRGCISKAVFNDNDILRPLISQPRYKTLHEVELGCSQVLTAGNDDPISFLGPKSYVSFPSWNAKEEGIFQCSLKTVVLEAPLLYHLGQQNNFIALEITQGHLRVMLDKGSGIYVLENARFISDGKWHTVTLSAHINQIELIVDGERAEQTFLSEDEENYLDLEGHLFIGGIDKKVLAEIRNRDLSTILGEQTVSGSFVGCIQDLKVNSVKKSLPDAILTKGIYTECEDEESVANGQFEDPVTPSASHVQVPTASPTFAPCLLSKNMPEAFNNFTRLLSLRPLIVKEGGGAVLELEHVHPTLDLSSIRVRHSQVLFKVTEDGIHGRLKVNLPGARSRKAFTLLDVINRHIIYNHDGSEGPLDWLTFDVSVYSKQEIPDCLKQGQRYIFTINITPVNDPPELIFPNGNLMMILENTWKALGPDVVQAVDVDTNCAELRIMVVSGSGLGYIHNVKNPDQRIGEFSCQDLEAGDIRYVHRGNEDSQLTMQVSDGERVSAASLLRITVLEPDLQVGNNTGLILPQGGTSFITISNLSVETNVMEQRVDVWYNITDVLYYGEVQKQDTDGEWKPVNQFQQQDLELGHLRYFSTDPESREIDMTERLHFAARVGQKLLENNIFLIKIKRAKITLVTMAPNELMNIRRGMITQDALEAAVEDKTVSADQLRYVILKSPVNGKLLVANEELVVGSTFTQEDLKQIGLTYIAMIRNAEETEDSFQFQVFFESRHSPVYTYPILIAIDPELPALVIKGLVVMEGGTQSITENELFVKSESSIAFAYNITHGPQHGKLIAQASGQGPITTFTNEDILQERLWYKHDDSESEEDEFGFVVLKQFEGEADSESNQVHGIMRISIQPQNDQPPMQVVDKIFNITVNGQRLLTTEQLRFHDADSDFDDSQLIYTKWSISNGDIVSAADTAQTLSRFTQEDMEKKRVLFEHHGAHRGRFQLQVSDGVHQTTAVMDVQASDPYLRLITNTKLMVLQRQEATINGLHLSVESNMDIRSEEEIIYQVTDPPGYGEILVNGEVGLAFSQQDINQGQVVYRHNGNRQSKDSFNFLVGVNQMQVMGTFGIQIFLESHRNSPTVLHNKKLFVKQGKATTISKEQLLVSHNDSAPSDVIYTVKTPPLHGQLVMVTDSQPLARQGHIQSFSQKDINRGKIQYFNSRLSPQGDVFILDVTNGYQTVEGLTVFVEVIPDAVLSVTQNISVREGDLEAITEQVLNVSSYLTNLNLDLNFFIVEAPQRGIIEHQRRPGVRLSQFTMEEVKEGRVFYAHDNSETLTDSFTLVLNSSAIARLSQPVTVTVSVVPVNDEVPVISVNTGLELWEDTVAAITQDMLNSEDRDSPPEKVVYSISSPSNGHVTLTSSLESNILQFTQAQINAGEIRFAHYGSLLGGFQFEVSDGVNHSPTQLFMVSAKRSDILIEIKEHLRVYPGTRQQITRQHLNTVTNDERAESWSITYEIETAPALGSIITGRGANKTEQLFSFTQADLEAGTVFYQHNRPNEPFWKAQDSLQFTVSTLFATSEKQILKVWISFEVQNSEQKTQLWNNKGLVVSEGQSAVIDQSVLDASNLLESIQTSEQSAYDVVFEVTAQPEHGILSVADTSKVQYFFQSDLVDSKLRYTHDNSDTLTDHLVIRAWLSPKRKIFSNPAVDGKTIVISEIFNITVTPASVNPLLLLTQIVTLHVLQGSSLELTQDHMYTLAPDNGPEEIQYNIIDDPGNGFFAHKVLDSAVIKHFTQADINTGRVLFKATGNPSTSTFHFSVSVEKHLPVTGSVTTEVTAVIVSVIHNRNILLLQGDEMIPITREELLVDSNSNESILYKITQQPSKGSLSVNQTVVSRFTQKHIDDGELKYHMTNLSDSQDSFRFLALTRGGNVSGTVNITVKPLVRVERNLQWPRGTTVLIDVDTLDASELFNRSRSIPSFNIVREPTVGRLIIVHEQNGTQRPLGNKFTQSDLEEGKVAIEVFDYGETGSSSKTDSIQFILTADGVPPGIGTLEFNTIPYVPTQHYNATLLKILSLGDSMLPKSSSSPTVSEADKVDPNFSTTWNLNKEERRGSMSTSSSIITRPQPTATNEKILVSTDNSLMAIIITVILIALLLLIAFIVVFYIMKRNKTGKHNVQVAASKPKNGTVEKETFRKTELAQSVPLVPVTPLNGAQPNTSHGDNDPNQFCRTSNPPLKTNQYWV
eukprot:gi/632939203/ref/XP_007908172.1/ PREDICTED: chondroitin sulfate proteoglycan 4 [Callorhinchus milii]